MPNLQAGAPSRVIDINSEAHRFGGLNIHDLKWEKRPYIGLRGYGAAKIAQVLTMQEYARKLDGSGVTVNAMHPGAVRSGIGMNNGLLYRLYSRYILNIFLKDPKIAGNAIYYLAAAPEMAGISGRFFNQTIEEKPAPYIMSPEIRKSIWTISEQLTVPYLEKET
jgi:NAD(P)-dependent dehydrogenase (short-subunit alcohol dehydrogenase family)